MYLYLAHKKIGKVPTGDARIHLDRDVPNRHAGYTAFFCALYGGPIYFGIWLFFYGPDLNAIAKNYPVTLSPTRKITTATLLLLIAAPIAVLIYNVGTIPMRFGAIHLESFIEKNTP